MSNHRHLGIKRSIRYRLAQSEAIIFESLIKVKICFYQTTQEELENWKVPTITEKYLKTHSRNKVTGPTRKAENSYQSFKNM